ncbi:hypothetical protein DCAR_0626541 [Daucus carota subsp. sativus]|uniref:Uncharacterized protein n=1 Tax=Daucus carota subsp. sativus TaxID=79200 RepID=A0AAF0XHG8_DAUCS|nr:hypothetical protein DCAR_0626541 [Daucus carota subsp. sativus]
MSADPALVDEDASSGSGDDINMLDGNNKRQTATPGSGRRKRSRKATGDVIVDAMLEIAAASKMRAAAIMKNEERFSISKCIKMTYGLLSSISPGFGSYFCHAYKLRQIFALKCYYYLFIFETSTYDCSFP